MKRFVTYMYIYDKCEKQKNIGFIKVDVNDDIFKLDIRLQNVGKLNRRCPILIMTNTKELTGIPIGEFDIRKGGGNGQYVLEKNNIKESGYTIDDVIGIRINISDEILLASCWTAEAATTITGNCVIWSKSSNEKKEQKERMNKVHNNSVQNENVKNDNVQKNMQNSNVQNNITHNSSLKEKENDENILGKENNGSIKRIDLADIKKLPKKNWYLCNNSFLLHGFFAYHYLVIKQVEKDGIKKLYLGVPGVYERPEKAMALLFGFPEFDAKNSNQPEPIGEFGYWYCLLDT